MKTTILVVEDEARTRELLVTMLNSLNLDLHIIQAATVVAATRAIQQQKPSIVLLDIHLPDGTGFDILDFTQENQFKTIFSTAHEEFAIRAIKSAAFDYLLKPISPVELKESVLRALESSANGNNNYVDVLRGNMLSAVPEKLVLHTSDSIFVIQTADLIRCESEKNYTTFYISDGRKIITSKTIKDYDTLLNELPFYRCHRSHILNFNYFDRYDKKEGGTIIMKNEHHVPLARSNRDAFFALIEQM
jgi:two-component system, LytTR family, response regulator